MEAARRIEAPLLEPGGAFDAERVNARFLRESANLPIEVRKFVLAKLHEFALHGPVKRNHARIDEDACRAARQSAAANSSRNTRYSRR